MELSLLKNKTGSFSSFKAESVCTTTVQVMAMCGKSNTSKSWIKRRTLVFFAVSLFVEQRVSLLLHQVSPLYLKLFIFVTYSIIPIYPAVKCFSLVPSNSTGGDVL